MLKKDVSINESIKMWANKPIDNRFITKSILDLDKYITYPYIGLIFYSELEDLYFKVTGLADGFRNVRTNTVVRYNEGQHDVAGGSRIPGYFVGSYEKLNISPDFSNYYTKEEIDTKLQEIKDLINP